MKKLLSLSPSKIFIFCGLGLVMTLGAFWHHQTNQMQLDRMGILNQASGTCFARISQSFTAIMIKDIRSPYLNDGFLGLSNECLDETAKTIAPFKSSMGKGHDYLNMMAAEVHWFHEMLTKIHAPMLAGQNQTASTNGLASKYSKIEGLKNNLVDEIESYSQKIKKVQASDEVLMGAGLMIFVIALSLLSLQEFNRVQLRREVEGEALSLLKAGQNHVGAMVDTLVDRALSSQGLTVTSQIFRDYHEALLERPAKNQNVSDDSVIRANPLTATMVEEAEEQKSVNNEIKNTARSSFKEVLVSLQNIHAKDLLQASDVRDVQLAVEFEGLEQMMNAAVNKMAEKRMDNKKILISNQIHTDRAVITMFLGGNTFTASELEYMSNETSTINTTDMNLMILKELTNETGIRPVLENKLDRHGKITGLSVRFVINRAPKENKSKLISVMRGKKKDLARELVN